MKGIFSKRQPVAIQHIPEKTATVQAETPLKEFVCPHGPTKGRVVVTILGVECEFDGSPYCIPCTEKYLNQFSTLCAFCHRPIFPGDPVGLAWDSASHPYTHLTFQCCETGGLGCGQWGEGRLITLHEINPEKYSAGCKTVMDRVVKELGLEGTNLKLVASVTSHPTKRD